MGYKAVIFDIDGTLVDSNEQHVNAWGFAFHEVGHPQELEDIRGQIGKGGDLLVPTLAPDLDANARQHVSAAHGRYFTELYLDTIRAFDRASDLLRWVHDHGCKVVLASSAAQAEVDHYVDLLGVKGIVDASTSIDDVERSKPEPDIFGVALDKVGLKASDAIVVGDTIYDIEAASRLGMSAIGLMSGPFEEAALREAGAIAIYDNASALLADICQSPLHEDI